jgi:foldase protein PrsA
MGSRARGVALVLVLVGAMLAGCGGTSSSTTSGNAAIVNGKAISMADYEKQVKIVRESMIEQGFDAKTAEGQAMIDQMRVDLLSQMIDAELMRQAAQKEGITVTDADVTARMGEIKADAGGEEAFKQTLKDANLTEDEFRTLVVRDQILYERLYDKLTKSLPTTADQVHVRHILLNTDKEATDAQARLVKGEDFATVAKELSLDTQTKDSGGDLGFFPRGVLDAAFENTVFSLKINEIAKVQTDYGFHVVQLLETASNRALDPELLQYLGEEAINTYMDSVRASATIEELVKFAPTPTPSQ